MWADFKKNLADYTQKDQELIGRAFQIAEDSHRLQERASGDPYITHPIAVALEMIKRKMDAATVAASILHDVLEDTRITKEELVRQIGEEVAFLVEGLTKLDRVRYQGSERRVESARKMFLAVAEDIRVVLIKLADRLHNMKTLGALPPDKQKRTAEETLELYAPLAYRLGMGELKGELEDLAFPVVYPEEYAWITAEVKDVLSERVAYLKKVAPVVEEELKKGSLKKFTIDFRAKHYYSLWKKLLRHNMDLGRITDLAALRIIVPTIEDCYRALGVIHAAWRPLPGRVKDYISLPKPNGYKSLHTTVLCVDGKLTEFQIRTRQMHEEAEFGIPAHWVWEQAGKPKKGVRADEQKIAWVKKLREWAESSGEEFLEAIKIDFFKDRIFVLTPKGEVIDLPDGSTPIDFAYHIHSEIGDHMSGAKVNGKMVPFSHKLASGDAVEILTSKNQKPSTSWLEIAHTSAARGHIRSALRKLGIEPKTAGKEKSKKKSLTLLITRENRIGLLKDITTVLAKEHLNIIKTESDASSVAKPFIMIQFEHTRGLDLRKLLTRIKRIHGVKEVELKA